MTKHFVEANIRTGEATELWVHVAPTDGRPMEFDEAVTAYAFKLELQTGSDLAYRVRTRGENMHEALAAIEQDYTTSERRRFASTINSIAERQR